MTEDPRYKKTYCRDFCGYANCPYVWLNGLGSFNQGTGFTEEVADEIIAALQSTSAAQPGEVAEAMIEAGRSAQIDALAEGKRHSEVFAAIYLAMSRAAPPPAQPSAARSEPKPDGEKT